MASNNAMPPFYSVKVQFLLNCDRSYLEVNFYIWGMAQFGHVSAVNLSGQNTIINKWSARSSCRRGCKIGQLNSISFAGSDAMGHKFRIPVAQSLSRRSHLDTIPLKVCSAKAAYKIYDSLVNFKMKNYIKGMFVE